MSSLYRLVQSIFEEGDEDPDPGTEKAFQDAAHAMAEVGMSKDTIINHLGSIYFAMKEPT